MVKSGSDLNLAKEPLCANCSGQLGFHDLDGDLAVVLEVSGQVHRSHTPSADLPLDGVAVC